jgi:hypothetical protein
MSSLFLKLDSSHRINYASTNAGSFNIKLQRPMQGYYKLCSAYMPVTSYNISSTNNRIPFYENGAAKVAVLTPGYYASSDLIAQVATQMTAASSGFATYSATQSALPLRITVTSTQLFMFQFGSVPLNSCAAVLGYLPVDTPSATSQTATNMYNLATIRSFNIQLNSETQFTDVNGRGCTFVVPILGNSGSVSVYEPTKAFPQTVFFTSPTSQLTIQVSDDNGIPLNFSADFYLILKKC